MRISMPTGTLLTHIRHLASADEFTALTFAMNANPDYSESSFHIGRARSCFTGMMRILCSLRDNGEVELTLDLIHERLTLDGLISLLQVNNIDPIKHLLTHYLSSLPEITEQHLSGALKLPERSYEIHRFYQDYIKRQIDMLFAVLESK